MMIIPNIVSQEATIFPIKLVGTMSPYPKQNMVCQDHHMESGILANTELVGASMI